MEALSMNGEILKKIKSRGLRSVWLAGIASFANLNLLVALSPMNLFADYNYVVVMLGFIGFFASVGSLYFGIPYYDEETQMKHPRTLAMYIGLVLGSINLIGVMILTPLVFVVWGTIGLENSDFPGITSLF